MSRPRKLEAQEQFNVRLPRALIDRLEQQVETQTKRTGFPLSRSDVLRKAIELGLDVLDAESDAKPTRKR